MSLARLLLPLFGSYFNLTLVLGWQSLRLQPSPRLSALIFLSHLSFDVLEQHLSFGFNKLLFLVLACYIMVMF